MKKFFVLWLILFVLSGLYGCENKQEDTAIKEENIKDKITNMESFSCTGNITAISNKGENNYKVKLIWRKDGKYIIKTEEPEILNGNIILFDGKGIWQYNPNIKSKISFDGIGGEFNGKSKIFISEFMKSYLNGGNSLEEEIYLSGNKYLILYTDINGGKYFAKQKLWINSDNGVPNKLETFDNENNIVFSAEFSDFKFNEKFDDKIFEAENIDAAF